LRPVSIYGLSSLQEVKNREREKQSKAYTFNFKWNESSEYLSERTPRIMQKNKHSFDEIGTAIEMRRMTGRIGW
jgi:hypothetical protein